VDPTDLDAISYMTYWSQVKSRFTARLLAALLLPFLAFGAVGSSMSTVSVAKTVVSARKRARRAPRRLPQQFVPLLLCLFTVRSYKRKDGTVVRANDRSAPQK
jgi:hypothetical protein